MRSPVSFANGHRLACMLALLAAAAAGQAVTPRIAAGSQFSAALSSQGLVWTWGLNQAGQLGRTGDTATPQPVFGLNNIVDIACGTSHMLAITSGGTVLGWGANGSGQLGLGHTTNQLTPALMLTISGAVKVAAGSLHSLVLLGNGSVYACGSGANGRLGLCNGNANASTPVLIPALSNVVAISAGYQHSAAVTAAGMVYTWGNNFAGSLGNPALPASGACVPTLVPNLTGIASVKCGAYLTACLDTAGVLHGTGPWITGAYTQFQVLALPFPASAVALMCHDFLAWIPSGVHMALSTTGSVVTWGYGCHGSMGNSASGLSATGCVTTSTPVQPTGLGAGVAGIAFGFAHGLALMQSGEVMTWGLNDQSQLGYPPTYPLAPFTSAPSAIPDFDLNRFVLQLVPVGSFTELRYFQCEPTSVYANMCTTAAQASPHTGLMNFGGLWLPLGDAFAWIALIQAGYPMATGPINALGTAVVTLPMPNSALSGLTIHAVSFNLGAVGGTNTSHVITHMF